MIGEIYSVESPLRNIWTSLLHVTMVRIGCFFTQANANLYRTVSRELNVDLPQLFRLLGAYPWTAKTPATPISPITSSFSMTVPFLGTRSLSNPSGRTMSYDEQRRKMEMVYGNADTCVVNQIQCIYFFPLCPSLLLPFRLGFDGTRSEQTQAAVNTRNCRKGRFSHSHTRHGMAISGNKRALQCLQLKNYKCTTEPLDQLIEVCNWPSYIHHDKQYQDRLEEV